MCGRLMAGYECNFLMSVDNRYQGYSFEECQAFRGDEYFWEPKWNGDTLNLSWLPVGRIEVELTNAELYAIRGNFEWLSMPQTRNFRPDENQPDAVEAWRKGGLGH